MKLRNAVFMAAACLLLLTEATSATDFTWSGDVRVRQETLNTTSTVNQDRIRFRYGFKADVADNVQVITRFATGGGNRSTNATFSDFAGYALFLDQAYLVYRPQIEWLERYKLYAGKMKNYFASTILMWDGDTNPDGLGHELNLGALVFRAAQWSQKSNVKPELAQGIYAYQFGFMGDPFEIYLANYVDTSDTLTGAGNLKGNYYDFIATLTLGSFKFTFDYATETNTSKSGYYANLEWNKVKTAGDLAAKLGYAFYDDTFKPDFRDSDLGGPDKKGIILGAAYGLEDNIEASFTYFGMDQVSAPASTSTLLLDLVVKF